MTPHDFDAAVGRAITAWQSIEYFLENIFRIVVAGLGDSRAAGAAFNAIVGFNTKLKMTTAAIEFGLDDEWQTRWKTLDERLSRASRRRNRIAHYTVFQEIDDEAMAAAIEAGTPPPEVTYVMHSNFFDRERKRKVGAAPDVVTLKDLRVAAATFQETSNVLQAFYADLRAAR